MVMHTPLINRKKADNDVSFHVEITGFSRGSWALVMHVLHEWLSANKHSTDPKSVRSIEGVFKALEYHVVENSDGYSLGYPYMSSDYIPKPTSEFENEALRNARLRRAKELK